MPIREYLNEVDALPRSSSSTASSADTVTTDIDHHVDMRICIPDGDLKCSICHDYFDEPICTSCGHHFCRSCLLEWLNTQRNISTCPECRHLFPFGFDKNYLRLTKPDVFLSGVLRQLIYKPCPLVCGALIHPTKQQRHQDDCLEVLVACENNFLGCPSRIKRKDIKYHRNVCAFHPCSAAILGCLHLDSLVDIKEHERTCVMMRIKTYVDKERVNNFARPASSTTYNNNVDPNRPAESDISGMLDQIFPTDWNSRISMSVDPQISTSQGTVLVYGNIEARQNPLSLPTARLDVSNRGTVNANTPVGTTLVRHWTNDSMSSNNIHRSADHSMINVNLRDLETIAQNLAAIGSARPPL